MRCWKNRSRPTSAGRRRTIDVFQIYLPIAGMSVNLLLVLGLGGGVGFLSGLFGVGGRVSSHSAVDDDRDHARRGRGDRR